MGYNVIGDISKKFNFKGKCIEQPAMIYGAETQATTKKVENYVGPTTKRGC